MTIDIRRVTAGELASLIPVLVELLSDAVERGASLGFVAPVSSQEATRYWESLRPDLEAGTRVLVGAFSGERIVGAGQLALPSLPNARHRAELQKLFVDGMLRSHGVGRRLVAALHTEAQDHGRSLVVLNTRSGGPAERFYKQFGYREVGVIPGYMIGADGERLASVTMYLDLGSRVDVRDARSA